MPWPSTGSTNLRDHGTQTVRANETAAYGFNERLRWPMIFLNSPKGWAGPEMIDGLQIERTFLSYQVLLSGPATHPEHLRLLADWLRSNRPEELFDEHGRL
jgi:xylulose-5-phosphate/fructose-6-phosphate phosphoketolase